MATPTAEHLQTTKPMLRYLNGTFEDGITYGEGSNTELADDMFDVYTDATWGNYRR